MMGRLRDKQIEGLKRGDIILVKLEGKGSVQKNERPCVVIQNNIGNKYSPCTIVCPITKRMKKVMPTHVSLAMSDYSKLPYDSQILAEQIVTIDKKEQIVGDIPFFKLSPEDIKRLNKALVISIEIGECG